MLLDFSFLPHHREYSESAVPKKEWLEWTALFRKGELKLEELRPAVDTEASVRPPPTAEEDALDQVAAMDYITGKGDWDPGSSDASVLPLPSQNQRTGLVLKNIQFAAAMPDARQFLKLEYPIKLAVIGTPFSGKFPKRFSPCRGVSSVQQASALAPKPAKRKPGRPRKVVEEGAAIEGSGGANENVAEEEYCNSQEQPAGAAPKSTKHKPGRPQKVAEEETAAMEESGGTGENIAEGR
ncbi:hypothetical protein CBR_g52306 [Chara braunii]|uniref:Uncharacterized protein n=1 Tax=Chara braunii TaxID=69332 RepID=A0A388MAD9_CHABU|nr:hypothetical protein CBR_g52306 [Chara braunii]|eukprot:GBG91419.1 hypothetical protein CBR_g52306 [Chara braunii]